MWNLSYHTKWTIGKIVNAIEPNTMYVVVVRYGIRFVFWLKRKSFDCENENGESITANTYGDFVYCQLQCAIDTIIVMINNCLCGNAFTDIIAKGIIFARHILCCYWLPIVSSFLLLFGNEYVLHITSAHCLFACVLDVWAVNPLIHSSSLLSILHPHLSFYHFPPSFVSFRSPFTAPNPTIRKMIRWIAWKSELNMIDCLFWWIYGTSNTNSNVLWNVETWFDFTYNGSMVMMMIMVFFFFCKWCFIILFFDSFFVHFSFDFMYASMDACIWKRYELKILLKFRDHFRLSFHISTNRHSYKIHTNTRTNSHFAFNTEHPLGYRLNACRKSTSIIFNSCENWFVFMLVVRFILHEKRISLEINEHSRLHV